MKTCNPSGTTTLSSPEKLLLQNAFGSSELPILLPERFFSNIFFLHVKIATEKIMLDVSYKKTGAQNAYISYEKLESRLKAIPQEFFADVLNFFDLLEYKIDVVKSEKKKEKKRSVQEGLDLLEKIAGCVPESVSLEDAKAEYFAEKYGVDK